MSGEAARRARELVEARFALDHPRLYVNRPQHMAWAAQVVREDRAGRMAARMAAAGMQLTSV